MKRRAFLASTILSTTVLLRGKTAHAAPATPEAPVCVPGLDFVSAEATYFKAYEHYHLLSIPVSVLMNPTDAGYTVRTSTLDQDSLDTVAFEKFLKESGLPEALRTHSHEVKFTKDQLVRIGNGEANVEIAVPTPKGNLAHKFYFTATKSALVKIKRARASRG